MSPDDTAAFLQAINSLSAKIDALRSENTHEHNCLHDKVNDTRERVVRLEAHGDTRKLLWTPFYSAAAVIIASAIFTGIAFLVRLWSKGM